MNRSNLEHLIRSASQITGDHQIIIVGSQAIHASITKVPYIAALSMEADIYPKNMPEKHDLIDVMIGEDSIFHDTYKYYAQGVDKNTSILPYDWEERVVKIHIDEKIEGQNVEGICIGLYDLVL